MHIINTTIVHVSCSCGFHKSTITASEARRLGYLHAQENAPSIVINTCSQECVDGIGRAEEAGDYWHHILCPNHNVDSCCASTLELPYGGNVNESLHVSRQHKFVIERINSL